MKPYIKQLGSKGKIKIWQVDGNYIRNKLDTNFNNSGHHYSFNLIPLNEIWIDKDFSKRGDEKLLTDQCLKEIELIKKGHSLYNAMTLASKQAKKEREKLNPISVKDTYKNIHVKKLDKYSGNGINVWLINGKLVRDVFYIFFTEGGHHYVYKFVPENEVWVDDSLNPDEYGYVIFHELIERNLMKYDKLTYNQAHDIAIVYEEKIRKLKTDPYPLIMNELKRKKM